MSILAFAPLVQHVRWAMRSAPTHCVSVSRSYVIASKSPLLPLLPLLSSSIPLLHLASRCCVAGYLL